MKTFRNRFLLTLAFALSCIGVFAQGPPEPPPEPTSVPPPVGLPIDSNIIFLLIIALLFGIYVIYKDRLKTKYPI
jgi:hypothetical protein